MEDNNKNLEEQEDQDQAEPGFGVDANQPNPPDLADSAEVHRQSFRERYPEIYHQQQKSIKKSAAKQKAGEAWGEAKDQAKKFVEQRVKQAAIQAIRSAAIAAWSWVSAAVGPYVGIIIVVVLLLLLTAAPAWGIWNRAQKGGYGNAAPAYASFNNSEDYAMLIEFFSNIKGGNAASIKSAAEAIKAKIAEGKITFKDNAQATNILDQMIQLCDSALAAGGTLDQAKMMDLRAKLIDLFDMSNPVALPGKFVHPFGSTKITSFNNTLHGRSVMRPEHVEHHNVFNGYSSPGNGDAVDINQSIGTPVYSMFSGTVRVEGEGRYSRVVVTSDSSDPSYGPNKIEAWYCHVSNRTSAKTVQAGDKIATLGVSGIGHVHLEVWVNGKSIHTTAEDLSSGKYGDNHGHYMWDHIKIALRLQDN